MVKAVRPPSADSVRQSARHVLFVEGENPKGFDVPVLEKLMRNIIRVQPLGSSYSVKDVAQALRKYHQDYYFLTDRDHHDDAFVRRCWDSFPSPDTHNLLVWRRRELESYFLDSSYLQLVDDGERANRRRIKSAQEIDKIVLQACKARLYLDAANQVIAEVRENNKANWIRFFKNPQELATADQARRRLVERPEFRTKKDSMTARMSERHLEERFDAVLSEMTGGQETLEHGTGTWLERIRAKKVWSSVVERCFRVTGRDGHDVRGPEKSKQVALSLVSRDLSEQPEDFRELYALIAARIKS